MEVTSRRFLSLSEKPVVMALANEFPQEARRRRCAQIDGVILIASRRYLLWRV